MTTAPHAPALLDDVLDRLRDLTRRGADAHAAMACAAELRSARPQSRVEIVWEYGQDERLHFDALVPVRDGVACLSYEPSTPTPLALHAAVRWREGELLCVDGRRLLVHEAMVLLDAIWDEARMLERLVDACIIDRLLEDDPWQAPAEQLQRAVDDFRSRHGLVDAASTERWLAARGLVLADLEASLERELAMVQLRRRLVGDAAAAAFARAPSDYDRVELASFEVANRDEAQACLAALASGVAWYEVAAATASARGIRFDRVLRSTIQPIDDAPLRSGAMLAIRIRGKLRVASIRSIAAATWDDGTRDEVERRAFAAWLDDARARADVRWNWGR